MLMAIPPIVIFKTKTVPKENFPADVVITVNPKGWMDEEKMNEWLSEIYIKRPGGPGAAKGRIVSGLETA